MRAKGKFPLPLPVTVLITDHHLCWLGHGYDRGTCPSLLVQGRGVWACLPHIHRQDTPVNFSFSVFRGMEDAGETQTWGKQDALNPAEEGGLVGAHAC